MAENKTKVEETEVKTKKVIKKENVKKKDTKETVKKVESSTKKEKRQVKPKTVTKKVKKEEQVEPKKEEKLDEVKVEEPKEVVNHEPPKNSSRYRKLIEKYKKRNRVVEVIIACVILVVAFILACNSTFLKTNYTKKVNNSTISIDLPRFTYFVSSTDDQIVFKTLRKSQNTRKFFEEFLESEKFDIYYCGDSKTPYYYSNVGKYFIYDIKVTKNFAIKTITVNYTTVDYDDFCSTIK